MLTESNRVIHGDCLTVMRDLPADCVDLVMCSPPYEDARTYGIDFRLRGQDWVDWMVERIREMSRICKGLVAVVCEGKTRNFRYSATPILLMADLHRAGFNLRKPATFNRVGIPGSGGPDWLRNDYEFIVCVTRPGKLPWSDNTAMGHPPKWAPGGEMSNRTTDGARVNERDSFGFTPNGGEPSETQRKNGARRASFGRPGKTRKKNGEMESRPKARHFVHTKKNGEQVVRENRKVMTRERDGQQDESQSYTVPVLANPGNVISCIVGGGVMGSKLCHENEAPFPEDLAEFFIRSFCPEGGIVLDPFSGSGTTAAVAEKWGRKWLAIDSRESQCELTKRRIAEVRKPLTPGATA